MTQFLVGERVVLDCDNPYLHGAVAYVEALAEWGAFVRCGAAATGRYRAAWGEMRPWREPEPEPATAARDGREQAREGGYSGDACSACGSFRMKRTGVCLCCEDCGSTSGGCS